MEDHRDVLVLSGTPTAIGKYGGGLAAVPPCDLAATVVREAVTRAGVEPSDVGHAVFGKVIHTEVRDMYLGRVAAVNGGLPAKTPAFTLNRLCGSGLQAIVSAAQAIRPGGCDVAVAGEAESMSRVGPEYSIVGGDLRLPVAAWSCQAAIWYSWVSPPRTCFSRIR
jgi:acetyl-CoA C-acetyltransferase